MNYYVTLFDSHYLTRGICLYESLVKCSKTDFRLVVIAMNDKCAELLNRLSLQKMIVVPLSDFEDEELLSVKMTRSRAEYCWSSTAKSIIYVFDNFNAKECTYIDADIMFFEDPEILIKQIPEDKSVMITEHRYTLEYDQTTTSGKYCVQFMYFKRDNNGLKALYWWKDRCIEWCGSQTTDGKMGDQMYLDDWMERFEGIYEMENLGGGIAPWNVQQYKFNLVNDKIEFYHMNSKETGNVIFYHFHAIEFFDKDVVRLCPAFYWIPDTAISCIYKYYIRQLHEICDKYEIVDISYSNADIFRSDENKLCHEKNFYNFSLFL